MVIGVIMLVCLIIDIFFINDGISLFCDEICRNLLGNIFLVCFDFSWFFEELFVVKIRCEGVSVICLVGFLVLIKMCEVWGMLGLKFVNIIILL